MAFADLRSVHGQPSHAHLAPAKNVGAARARGERETATEPLPIDFGDVILSEMIKTRYGALAKSERCHGLGRHAPHIPTDPKPNPEDWSCARERY